MEVTTTTNRIQPLMAAAAVSLTVVSLVGTAAIAGLLPNSHGVPVDGAGLPRHWLPGKWMDLCVTTVQMMMQ